jgi:mono/diheme cytochrome c family protein
VHFFGGGNGFSKDSQMTKGRVVLYALPVVWALGAAWAFWFLTAHGFSAREKPTWYEERLARVARGLATPRGARELKNPVAADALSIAEARDHFADHCAICHGNNGSGKTLIGENLYPPAPDMRGETTQELSDGELFYIIKNGIRFTGMPGFGGDDEENWKLVLFIRHLPKLTPKELELMHEVNNLETESDGAGSALKE